MANQEVTVKDRTIHDRADFAISIDFRRGTETPSRVFRAMSELIESFEHIDATLIQSFGVTIRPVLLLEDIEAGSIKTWLTSVLKETPDSALKDGEVKKVIGHYLVKAKYAIINWTEGKTTVTDRKEIAKLQEELVGLARETNFNRVPAYVQPDPRRLLEGLQGVSSAMSNLQSGDSVTYISSAGDLGFNAAFSVVPEAFDDLLTDSIISNTAQLLLKIKKPDYLGNSQWDLRHGRRTIQAHISDEHWLGLFRARAVTVRPGDAIRADVQIDALYGTDGELVNERYTIVKVHEVVEPPEGSQLPLLDADA